MQVGCEHYTHIYDLRGPQDEDKGAEKGTKSLAMRSSGIAPTQISRGLLFRSLFLQDPRGVKVRLEPRELFLRTLLQRHVPCAVDRSGTSVQTRWTYSGQQPSPLIACGLDCTEHVLANKTKTKQKKKTPLSLRIDVKDE